MGATKADRWEADDIAMSCLYMWHSFDGGKFFIETAQNQVSGH